ncbi:UNVERIFIED_CONTAM: hypothetical protein HDU68_002848, partial [Siphonaria sp. JEL0065]
MGDYYTSISSTLLTGEQGSSSSASPYLMALYRKRSLGANHKRGKPVGRTARAASCKRDGRE